MAAWCAARPLAAALALLALVGAAQSLDTSTRSVVKAAAGYVAEYQPQLTAIVADELYTQEIVSQSPRDALMPRSRHMRSEVFFMFAPANHHWMAIRDVLAVDGNTLRDRPDLREALERLPAQDVAARFKEFNSRYNIGRTYRNVNEPTLTLLVLDEHHRARFSFDRKRIERTGATILVTIAFTEKESPTLIHDPRRGRVFSKGEFIVEAGTGRVRRTVLTAKTEDVRVELTTTYAADERLGIWVPTLFREHYERGASPNSKVLDSSSEYERIFCEARYNNFRRFETSARIK